QQLALFRALWCFGAVRESSDQVFSIRIGGKRDGLRLRLYRATLRANCYWANECRRTDSGRACSSRLRWLQRSSHLIYELAVQFVHWCTGSQNECSDHYAAHTRWTHSSCGIRSVKVGGARLSVTIQKRAAWKRLQ
ncbi:unnamed protein product, partial [Ixodes persulcatus]